MLEVLGKNKSQGKSSSSDIPSKFKDKCFVYESVTFKGEAKEKAKSDKVLVKARFVSNFEGDRLAGDATLDSFLIGDFLDEEEEP